MDDEEIPPTLFSIVRMLRRIIELVTFVPWTFSSVLLHLSAVFVETSALVIVSPYSFG